MDSHRVNGRNDRSSTTAESSAQDADRGGAARRGPSRTALIALGIGASALLVGGSAAVALLLSSTTTRSPETASVPASRVARIHAALHEMGKLCTQNAGAVARHRIGLDVDRLISFARQFPDARFTIDEEDGRSLNLLLIAREEMQNCAPAAAVRANRALPSAYRSAPASTTTGRGAPPRK